MFSSFMFFFYGVLWGCLVLFQVYFDCCWFVIRWFVLVYSAFFVLRFILFVFSFWHTDGLVEFGYFVFVVCDCRRIILLCSDIAICRTRAMCEKAKELMVVFCSSTLSHPHSPLSWMNWTSRSVMLTYSSFISDSYAVTIEKTRRVNRLRSLIVHWSS